MTDNTVRIGSQNVRYSMPVPVTPALRVDSPAEAVPTESVKISTPVTVQLEPSKDVPPPLVSLSGQGFVGQGMTVQPKTGVIFMDDSLKDFTSYLNGTGHQALTTGGLETMKPDSWASGTLQYAHQLLAAPANYGSQWNSLLRQNGASGLAAAMPHTTLTIAGYTAFQSVGTTFSPGETIASSPGYYHSLEHGFNVGGAVSEVATAQGRTPQRTQFLAQVATIHDFDERLNLQAPDKARKIGSPARVQVTLTWMDQNQEALQQRMGWTPADFGEAKALIARTDFPLDDKARNYGTPYDGKSPIQVYKDLIGALPEARRAAVMEDGMLLSYADQVGNYIGTRDQAEQTVRGLATEIGIPGDAMLSGSAAFQKNVGADTAIDRQVASDLGVHGVTFFSKDQLDASLSPASQANLRTNRAFFESVAKTA